MGYRFTAPPKKSLDALQKGAGEFLGQQEDIKGLVESAKTNPKKMTPHKIFHIGLKDAAAGKAIATSKLTGWRYLVEGKQAGCMAFEVNCDDHDKHDFAGVNFGPYGAATLSSLKEIEGEKSISDGDFEVSVIRVPALYVMALWFHGNDAQEDLVVPIPHVPAFLLEKKTFTATEFNAALIEAAKERLKFDETAR